MIEEIYHGPQDYLIKYKVGDNRCSVEFVVIEISGEEISPDAGRLMFPKQDAINSDNTTYNSEETQVFLKGSIKFDGCSNFYFPDSVYHFCGGADAMDLGNLFRRLFEITKVNVENYLGNEIITY